MSVGDDDRSSKKGKTGINRYMGEKSVNKKGLFSRIRDAIFGDRDLWQQLLSVAIIISIAGALISAVISIILGNSLIAIIAYFASCILAAASLVMYLRAKNMIYAAVFFSVVTNFILMPIMYFSSGGYLGGMPLWLLLSLVLTWMVVRNKFMYVLYGLELLFQCGCILYSEYHPETVIYFQNGSDTALDVIQSLVLVSLIIGMIIRYINGAYEKKKAELDETNDYLEKANERITLQSMYTLAKTIDAKDKYTNGHSMRVAEYTKMIAKRLGYSKEELDVIQNMAMLHDVGKIGVPDAIINKSSTLTDEEFAIIKEHPSIGYDILSEMPEMEEIGVGARWHHERYDGKGYPDGLKGEEIPLAARIISVADAYDAMTSNRSYRDNLSQNEVVREFENGRGTQFDPKIADIMLEIIREDPDYELHE